MIINPKKQLALIILAWIAFCVQTADGQTDRLQWKLKTGDQFLATLTQTSQTHTKVDSRETSVDSSTTIVFDWNVVDVEANGDAVVEQSLVSIKLRVTNPAVPEQAVDYDTSSEEKPSKVSKKLLDQVLPLIGLKFNVVMTPLGEIQEVTLPDETTEKLNRLPDTLKLRALFSQPGLKDMLGAAAIVLPDEKLSDGASWSDDSNTVTALGEFNRNREYTLVGKKTIDGREMAEFSLNATLEPVAEQDPALQPGSSLKGKLVDFSGSGQLMLDVEGGYFSNSKIRNVVRSEKPYREKTIRTVVTNQIEMSVQPK